LSLSEKLIFFEVVVFCQKFRSKVPVIGTGVPYALPVQLAFKLIETPVVNGFAVEADEKQFFACTYNRTMIPLALAGTVPVPLRESFWFA
jgi:hypothetical protein